jgi:hypothetical protein
MEYARKRDKELAREQESNGRPRKERPPPDDADREMMRELTRQRDKMEEKAEQLEGELKRSKAKAHEGRMQLALETQRMHDELNNQRRKVHDLSRDLEQAQKQISLYESAAKRGGRTLPPRVISMPPTADDLGLAAGGMVAADGGGGARGLGHSATMGDLRTPGLLDPSGMRPVTAPGENAAGVAAAYEGAPSHTAPALSVSSSVDGGSTRLELTEAMERHMLENARLRENLLHFTSKASKGRKKKGGSSLGMPLPPV